MAREEFAIPSSKSSSVGKDLDAVRNLSWKRHISLILLLLVAALSYLDRQIFTLFQDDIKAELGLNDSTLGLLTGFSFALFYGLAALPIARYADRGDRSAVVGICVIVWSLATALCGMASSFWTLVLARIGLAAGEAGAGPAANSLLVEIYPRDRRVFVLGAMLASSSAGLSGGLALGGWLSQWFGWRTVFFIIGLPGVVLGVMVYFFSLEPRRIKGLKTRSQHTAIPLRDVLKVFSSNRSLRWIALILATVPIPGFGLVLWGPSFFQRVHHMDKEQVGYLLGIAMLTGLVLGNLFAGWVGDRYGAKNPRFNGWLAASGLMAAFPFMLTFAFTTDTKIAIICFTFVEFLITLHLAPVLALAFAQVPERMWATTSATASILSGVGGIGLGGTLAGILSSLFTAKWGELSLQPALATLALFLLIGGTAAWMAARTAQPRLAEDL